MRKKVYIIHPTPTGLAADFFVRDAQPVTEEEARKKYGADYLMPGCPYVKMFLEHHPDYVLVASTDNQYTDGWGMSFDGYDLIPLEGERTNA